jgi:hypothetical protein
VRSQFTRLKKRKLDDESKVEDKPTARKKQRKQSGAIEESPKVEDKPTARKKQRKQSGAIEEVPKVVIEWNKDQDRALFMLWRKFGEHVDSWPKDELVKAVGQIPSEDIQARLNFLLEKLAASKS